MKASLRHYAPLIALLAFALFPFGWLTQLWATADLVGDTLFPNEVAHAVGHAAIFMAIGATLLLVFPGLRRRPLPYFGLVLFIALTQEGIQLIYKQRGVVLNDITDIGTDLVAAALVFALWYIKTKDERRKTRARQGQRPAEG